MKCGWGDECCGGDPRGCRQPGEEDFCGNLMRMWLAVSDPPVGEKPPVGDAPEKGRAADDFDAIAKRIAEIEKEREPTPAQD